MKQISILYAKALSFYYLSCLVCSLLFSLFFSFHIFNATIFQYGNYLISMLFSIIACIYITKKAEKKALLYILGYLGAQCIISLLLMPFLSLSIVRLLLKLGITFIVSLLFVIRK